ncbi:MAG TPA: ADOP family duplicated permease [Vicinamibacterales bacterium]|nr:ADOP family duplicated permease [Vicinamibacterales bacterium]
MLTGEPPRLAERLLAWSLVAADREAVLGDLCEEFHARARQEGAPAARRWYWAEVRRSILTNLRRRALEPDQPRRWNVSRASAALASAGGGLIQDLRYALRALAKAPTFTCGVVVTLTLGIGANTAIFSVVDGILLEPLPYPDADRLVSFAWRLPGGVSPANVSPLTFHHWKDHAQSFEAFAVTTPVTFHIAYDGAAERVSGVSGTSDLFKVIGVFPALGRGFIPEDRVTGSEPVVVISHGLWTRAFGARPDVIGQSITFDDRRHTVIGVMPATFRYEPEADVWSPLHLRADPRDWGLNYTVIGRLQAGIGLTRAQSEADQLFERLRSEHPRHMPPGTRGVEVVRLQDYLVAGVKPLLYVLLGAVALVLLIAFGNVANLLLSRSMTRARDLAVRRALGATSHRIVGHVLAEGLILALAGGVAGAMLAHAAVGALIASMPNQLPRLGAVAIDYRVLGFALLVSVALGVALGLIGSVRALRSDPGRVLKAAGTGADPGRQRLSNALIVGEVAVSVVLLIGAGLLVATFVNLRSVRLGFETDNILTVQLSPSLARFGSSAAGAELDRQLIERIRAIPAVTAVTTASSLPLERGPNFIFGIEGDPPDRISYVELRAVGPDYLSTLGIPLRAGRALRAADADNSLPVVIVNEALASRFGGPARALGRRIILGRGTSGAAAAREIVGVASNVADGRPGTRMFPTIYLPRTQFAGGASVNLLIRTTGRVPIEAEVQRVVRGIDARVPIVRMRPMKDVAWAAVAQQRFNMLLTSAFAALALALAMVGLYGLLSYQVAQRKREIGLRIALGARRPDVLAMIVRRGLMLTSVGLILGAAASVGFTRFLRTLLFGVTVTSPWVYAAVAGVLLLVAIVASIVPARRAMRADPIMALRSE